MSKNQYLILNLIGGLAALTLLFNVGFAQYNRHVGQQIQKVQTSLTDVPKLQRIGQNLILRLANASRNDRDIRDLLAKHKLEVKFQDQPQQTNP